MKSLACLVMLLIPVASASAPLWATVNGTLQLDEGLMVEVVARGASEFGIEVEGRAHQVDVKAVSAPNLGVVSLSGRIDGEEESYFLLCRSDEGEAVGMFRTAEGMAYRLGYSEGEYGIRPVDLEGWNACAGAVDSETIRQARKGRRPGIVSDGKSNDAAPTGSDDGSSQDILIGYTPAAETVMGGVSAIRAEAQLAVDAANLAYANSGIATRLRLVHVMPTDYDESTAWDYVDHVEYLWLPADGHMDELLVMRDRVGADFLSVLIDGRDFVGEVPTCGVAPIMQSDEINNDFEDLALSVVSVQCATDNWTLAHEVGHNRGCAHNREDATYDGAYPYSYGRRFVGSDDGWYRTVMAYDHFVGGYERVPFFTNPSVDYAGVPTGIAPGFTGEAHNALTHDNTALLCATFRTERTFVMFGWSGTSNGLFLNPYPSLNAARTATEDHDTIVIQNSEPGFTGIMVQPRVYTHDGPAGAVLGGI